MDMADKYEVQQGLLRWLSQLILNYEQSVDSVSYNSRVNQLQEMMAEVQDCSEQGELPWEVIARENPKETTVLDDPRYLERS